MESTGEVSQSSLGNQILQAHLDNDRQNFYPSAFTCPTPSSPGKEQIPELVILVLLQHLRVVEATVLLRKMARTWT